MDPLVQLSASGGELVEVSVPGSVAAVPNPENEVEAASGVERTMCVYVPASGVPHPKQAQVLFVLRDGAGAQGARDVMDALGIAALAEREHVIVVLPNPLEGGWNYSQDPCRDDDTQFIVRCFAALKPTVGVSGFNGLMLHLATSPDASAMAWTLASEHPLDAAAVMIGGFPAGYEPSEGRGAEQVAWLYEENPVAEGLLARANGECGTVERRDGRKLYVQRNNPCVTHCVSGAGLTGAELELAWETMLSGVRRWRNDVFGTYQPRVDFAARGFVPHVGDGTLGLSDGIPRTWYEYVPPRLRGTTDPVPLVLYFHGINCVGLYGAEQSGWADLADRDGFAVVFPDATIEMRWNVWDDPRLPSDVAFVRALIDHMEEVHPIDRTRVYLSGFSMGSMFSNALACSYPELFAGVVACNGPHQGYLASLDDSVQGMLMFNGGSVLRSLAPSDDEVSPTRRVADEKRAATAVRMPFVQFVGLEDNVGFGPGRVWPVTGEDDGMWPSTVSYWKRFNNVSDDEPFDSASPSGFASDRCEEVGERFVHQAWRSDDDGCPELYHLISVKRLPHAVDLRSIELGWELVKEWSRKPDGGLARIDER